jgi:hypothetical protein
MLSQFQLYVLARMQQGTLSNHHEGESAPYRPKDGMYSGFIHSRSATTTVPYRTIAALLKSELIEEDHRVETETTQGDNKWEVNSSNNYLLLYPFMLFYTHAIT